MVGTVSKLSELGSTSSISFVNLVQRMSKEAFEDRFRHFVLTEVTPRHWPDDLKDEFSIPSDLDGNSGDDAALNDDLQSVFILDGESITREGIAEKCRESFSDLLVILGKLKAQNEHFHERDLLDVTLPHHITELRSTEDLISIKEYLKSQGRWQNSNIIECLAERFPGVW